MPLEIIVFTLVVGGLAGVAAGCPRGDPDCPHHRKILGFGFGAIAGVGYMLLLGRKSLESVDLIALIFVAYLFANFINSFLPGKRKA